MRITWMLTIVLFHVQLWVEICDMSPAVDFPVMQYVNVLCVNLEVSDHLRE